MKKIPKYVEDLIERRKKLAYKLSYVCGELDDYCEKIGIDLADIDLPLFGHVEIYTNPEEAAKEVRDAINKKLLEVS